MRLPKLPYSISQAKNEIVQLRGINYSDNYGDGSLADSKNLSARRYPYISARRAREQLTEHSDVTALTAWEKLVTVKEGQLWYGDVCVGEVSKGKKQFAVINTKLVIFPDKKYVDLSTAILKPSTETITVMGATFGFDNVLGTDVIVIETDSVPFAAGDSVIVYGCENESNNKTAVISGVIINPAPEKPYAIISFPRGTFADNEETGEITITRQAVELDLKPLGAEMSFKGATFTTDIIGVKVPFTDDVPFVEGDSVTISGCTVNESNNKTAVIKGKHRIPGPDGVHTIQLLVSSDTFKEAEETGTVTLTRAIPDLDYICESENRIWGCSNKDRTIYASALGDPTNFYNYEDGISTCSYAVAVGSEGDFTGCCKLGSSVLFWKNNVLHKMLGSYPAEYTLHTYKMDGVAPNCYKSMQVINETLIYVGEHGVYSYSGSSSSLLSSALEGRSFSTAVGGSDGLRYYLSVREADNAYHLYTFDLKTGIWLYEDNTRVVDFARVGNNLYFLDSDGRVYLADNGEEDANIEWLAQFKPFYETSAGRKKHSKIILRTEMPSSSWMKVEVRCDGGRWIEVGKIVGAEADTQPFAVPINRCDKFELRLSGKGPFAIMNILRKFSVGGDI